MTQRMLVATRTTFRSLRTRNFRLFFAGQLTSQVGTWMQSVAIVWVVLDLTDSGVALGLVMAAQFLPMLLFGPWTGLLADRVDRHRLMIGTQIAFTLLALAFSVLMLSGHGSVAAMYALSGVFGIITALDNPTRRALVSELVAAEDVPNAVGLNSALMTGSRVVGPALAGALIAGPGVTWNFVVNAVTYLAVIVALLRMDRSAFRPAPRLAKAKGQLREGFRYMWHTPELRLSLLLVAVVGVAAFNFQVTLPLLAERTFEGGATAFTMLFATLSTGSLVGSLTVARRRDVDVAFLARAGAGMSIALFALASAPALPLALVAALPVGYFGMFVMSGSNALIQLHADPSMRGRVLAVTAMLFLGSTPIGGPILGWIAEVANARVAVAVGGAATVLAAIWVFRRLRSVEAGQHDELTPSPEPLAAA
jgi:MFS family permease